MPKVKERSESEWLKGQLREANKKIRQLEKQLKQYQKIEHMFQDSQDEEISFDTEDTFPNKKVCSECGKGSMETVDIVGRLFEICNICKHRKKISK